MRRLEGVWILLAFWGLTCLMLTGCNRRATHQHEVEHHAVYTCTMHPQIIRNEPGKCPICGMELIKKGEHASTLTDIKLNDLIKPTNQFVLSRVAVTTMQTGEVNIKTEALGRIAYDTRRIGVISSRVSGRIERLYVRYRYQKVSAGQRLMDIYSPQLLTYQQNLLFLLRSDPSNSTLINATKERLLLNGVSKQQLTEIIRSRKPSSSIAIYSNYSGHIHEAASQDMPTQVSSMNGGTTNMQDVSLTTEALNLREGMYVERGKPVFEVYNPDRAWVLIQLYAEQQGIVRLGDAVTVIPETAPGKVFQGTINFIEPFYRQDAKTLSARVYFNNAAMYIPIGSRVRATISSGTRVMDWVPETAVVSLGRDKVIFKREGAGFVAKRIETGYSADGRVQVISGLLPANTIATNGQFLMDSESFVKVNE